MLVENIEGSSLIIVKDSFTGLELDCNVGYSMSCSVNVIDEKAFAYATASESLKDVLSRFIDMCFSMCYRETFPGGAEYEELLASAQKMNGNIINQVANILECNGIAIEKLDINGIILGENEKNMFEKMRKMKAGMNNIVPDMSVDNLEWTCTCGTKNKSKFCTECGSPREKSM